MVISMTVVTEKNVIFNWKIIYEILSRKDKFFDKKDKWTHLMRLCRAIIRVHPLEIISDQLVNKDFMLL